MVAAHQTELLQMLASRLERLSADSRWARRASGLRGNILKLLEDAEAGVPLADSRLELLTGAAFTILRRAGEDIPDVETILKRGSPGN